MRTAVTQPRAVTFAAYKTSAHMEDLLTDLMQAISRRKATRDSDGALRVTLEYRKTDVLSRVNNRKAEGERLRRTTFTFSPAAGGRMVREIIHDRMLRTMTFVLEPWSTGWLTDRGRGTTTFCRQTALSFKHKNSKRIYKAACDMLPAGGAVISRERLKQMLDLQTPDSNQRLKRELTQACKEIGKSDAGFTLTFAETGQDIIFTTHAASTA